ncbi:MAG: ComEA family DNA-binding protein [Planctomycetota bacterium]
MTLPKRSSKNNRRGMTLLVIVVLVMLISLSAYRYTFVMESEYRLTRLQEELVQSRLSALSGVEYAAHLLEQPPVQRSARAGIGARERIYRRATQRDDTTPDLRQDRKESWQFGLVSASVENSVADASMRPVASATSGSLEESIHWRWGFENESAKLSIPAMLQLEQTRPGHFRSYLLTLPGLDEESADAWLDQLGVPRINGPSRRNTTMPVDQNTVGIIDNATTTDREESRDRIRALWYGGDLNQNYRLDPIEVQLLDKLSRSQSGLMSSGPTSTTPTPQFQPLQRYFTRTSGDRNERNDGRPRIYLNQPNLQRLHQELSSAFSNEIANFVIAYRQYGPNNGPRSANPIARSPLQPSPAQPSTTQLSKAFTPSTNNPPTGNSSVAAPAKGNLGNAPPSEITLSASEYAPVWTIPGTFVIANSLDLVGVSIALPAEGKQTASAPKKVLRSPFSSDNGERRNYLGKWLSDTTLVDTPVLEGRVDVTEAPAEVLMGIPGIDANLAQRIVEQRRSVASNPEALDSVAWLVESGVIDMAKLREIEPFLTNRSDVYTVQSIGFRDNRSPVYRCTVTIDARTIPASVLDLKVWHPWDRGFDIDSLNGITR